MKTIFWDFNGTILDDLDLCLTILNDMLKEEGHQPITKERYLDIFTFPIIEYYRLAGFDFKHRSYETLANIFITKYQKASLNLKLHEDTVKIVTYFKQQGYRQVVLSASQVNNLVEQLKHYQIFDLFDDVLGISNVYAASKTQIGLEYIQKHQIDLENSVMIGDTLHDRDVAGALNCGIIIYTKGHQAKHRFNGVKMVDRLIDLKKEIR